MTAPNPFGPPPAAPAPPQAPPNPFGQMPAPTMPAQQPAPSAAPPGYMVTSQATMPPQQQYGTPQGFGGQPGADPFGAPAPRAERPRIRDIYGRLLLIIPRRMEYNLPNRARDAKPGDTQDRMTADVIVLDGGTLLYGGAPEKQPPVPHSKSVEVPYKIEGIYISQKGLLSQSRDAITKMQTGQIGMVLGRLDVSPEARPGENAAYILTPFTEHDAGLARAWLAANPVTPFGQPGAGAPR